MASNTFKKKKIAVIGSGFSGLASATLLAREGHDVTIYEKNTHIGGRARHFETNGYMFDMGPSWYWMPDVFEKYFALFGKKVIDYYELKKLDPGFSVIYKSQASLDIPADFDSLCSLFENVETGGANNLREFIAQAEYKYEVGVNDLVYQPGHSITEFLSWQMLKDVLRLQVFSSFSKHARAYFKDPRLLALIEFPVLFLGAMPKDTPALYSLMNYAGLKQGTFYPMGGFGEIVKAFETLAVENGVKFETNSPITGFQFSKNKIVSIQLDKSTIPADAVIASADYHHVEQQLLPKEFRMYNENYWDKRTFAPSSLIFYVGVKKKIKKLSHHNLFFDEDFEPHAIEIYEEKQWPKKPLFYVCCPSKTDESVAPEGHENLFFLMPIAAGLKDSDTNTMHYYDLMMQRLESYCDEPIAPFVDFEKHYSVSNFESDYNAYKGNAYGLANTLFQTAIFKPKMKSSKVQNLFFTGQLTVPGPGVPPSIISGQVVAKELLDYFKN
jgi:phytoene desaturase